MSNLARQSVTSTYSFSNPDHLELSHLLAEFDTIGLEEIQNASLLDRVDTKYIFRLDQIFAILPQVSPFYRVLTISDTRLHAYKTLYFDTADFALYTKHHNGAASRYKVRARKYVDTDVAFFEIKHRTNQQRTVKSRLPIAHLVTHLNDQLVEFSHVHAFEDADNLEPKLWNDYLRMTLVSRDRPERVTLDVNLQYHWAQAYAVLPGIVIAEVKQTSNAAIGHSPDVLQQVCRGRVFTVQRCENQQLQATDALCTQSHARGG